MENKIDIAKKKNKRRRRLLSLKANSMEFCRCTSLHGLQYLGEQHRPIGERLFWLLTFLISLIVVTYYISRMWNKWQDSPVFVSFAETPTPVWDIPFPSITICSEIKIKQTLLNYTELCYNENKTLEEIEDFEKAALVCKSFTEFAVDFNRFFELGYEPENDTSVEGVAEFLRRVAPRLREIIPICIWRSNREPCFQLFKPIFTDDGLCYTFNSLNAQEMFRENTVQRERNYELQFPNSSLWNYEDQYTDTDSDEVYPLRAVTSGTSGGLLLLVKLDKENINPLCSMSIYGLKVTLTNPADYSVDVSNQYFRIPFDRDMVVGIKPQVMTTSAGLKDYPSERRRCYFSRERYLKFFNVYTQQNCNLECFTNYTMKSCGCVTFFMPHVENTSICNVRKLECTRRASDLFASDDSGMEQCFCLPSCTEIKYDIETSQAVLSMADTFKALAENYHMDEIPDEMYSAVSFFYKDSQFVRSQRSELYGAVDFIASCGGLLGLCLGFSVLSVVEIFYFFTMRIYSNFQVLKKEK